MNVKSIVFENGNGPRLLITGGVHGDEFEPMVAIRRLISILRDVDIQGSIQLVPVVNEAAFLRGHRVAEDGLDLARTCPGRVDGTVTERTAHMVSELIRQADAYVDLHTGGTELSVFPLTGYQLVSNTDVLDTQRKMAQAFNLPFVWGTSADHDGRTLSVARDAGVPAIYAEYMGSATMAPDGVQAYVDGCLNVMGMLGLIERKQPTCQVVRVVEDRRMDSGHMQVCTPSPITGIFEASVSLGEMVQQGQLLGTVSDFLGNESHQIRAGYRGVVLVMRTFPRVHQGEMLGVIAELQSEG